MGFKNSKDKTLMLENIPIVQDFVNLFLENIPGLPPKRNIDFTIELLPGTTPVSRAPYKMSVLELT